MGRLVRKEEVGEKNIVTLETSRGFYLLENGMISHNCDNCKLLWHTEGNLRIPKVYKMSELSSGYNTDWKNPIPTVGTTHPHCFDKETEVLTERGWIYFKNVNDEDRFLSVDLETGNSEWVPHIGLLKYKHTGHMRHIKSHRVDLMTTLDHMHVIGKKYKDEKYSMKLTSFHRISSEDLAEAILPLWEDQSVLPVNGITYELIRNCSVELVDYDDYVYDVELEKWHTLFVRRNGKVSLSGNCRHIMTFIPPNFGFDKSGALVFKGLGYDIWEEQRSQDGT